MASAPLTVASAKVHTASVEIDVMKIDGKQVTLSVFRQMLHEHLIDPDSGDFLGVPWGHVNYHPDKCADAATHLHVVWQKGSLIRQNTVVYRDLHPGQVVAVSRAVGDNWLIAAVLDDWFPTNLKIVRKQDFLKVSFNEDIVWIEIPKIVSKFFNEVYLRAAARDLEGAKQARLDFIEECNLLPDLPSRDDARAAVCAEVAKYNMRRQSLMTRWLELKALPQLFIAL